MRVIIQRVSSASVEINQQIKSKIGIGLLILLGIEHDDTFEDTEWLCGKIARLRIFGDENGAMNLSVLDVNGDVIVVSQFTLHASTKKRKPTFIYKSSTTRSCNTSLSTIYCNFAKRIGQADSNW